MNEYYRTLATVCAAVLLFVLGWAFGSRAAVLRDYSNCAAMMRDRDLANRDLKPGAAPPFYEGCAEHLDRVWGNREWRP